MRLVFLGAWMVVTYCMACLGASGAFAQSDHDLYLQRFHGGRQLDNYDTLEAVPGVVSAEPLPLLAPARHAISAAALDQAHAYAAQNNSKALLIWHGEGLEAEDYFQGTTASTELVSRSLAKPLAAIAVGRAIALGKIRSLDQSVADLIREWRGTPKAAMTVREVLNMTSGLLQQGTSPDPDNIWNRAYLHPRHDEILINEYPLTDKPGERYGYSNATGDLTAILIERATGQRYGEFLSRQVLQPLGAAGGRIWVDRVGGTAHAGCCILLPAQTWLRLGLLLLNDGVWRGNRLLPQGYVRAMRTPSRANPLYGLGIWIPHGGRQQIDFGGPNQNMGGPLQGEAYLADDLFMFDGNADQVLYMVPSRKLAILRMGDAPPRTPGWDNAVLANLILRDLDASR